MVSIHGEPTGARVLADIRFRPMDGTRTQPGGLHHAATLRINIWRGVSRIRNGASPQFPVIPFGADALQCTTATTSATATTTSIVPAATTISSYNAAAATAAHARRNERPDGNIDGGFLDIIPSVFPCV